MGQVDLVDKGSGVETRVLFVNLTRRCNIDCPRCYLTEINRARRETLDPTLLEQVLADPFFRNHDGPVVVIHQGGEPQLVGHRAFEDYVAAVCRAHPEARQTAVSNMVAAPPWFLDLAHRHFGGRIETTWAAGRKQTLAGEEATYQDMFAQSLARAIDAGLNCPVNVELNDATAQAGPDVLLDLMVKTGAQDCEFDLSFDFAAFRRNPAFGPGGVPFIPPTIPFAEVSAYLLALRRRRSLRGLNVRSYSLVAMSARGTDLPFNVQSESRFVTINPDGIITTVPLYSDVPQTYLGNARHSSLSDILAHPNRALRIDYERHRTRGCAGCRHWDACQGGPSHAPLFDGSGECAGLRRVLDRL